jgi:hypothetical protein
VKSAVAAAWGKEFQEARHPQCIGLPQFPHGGRSAGRKRYARQMERQVLGRFPTAVADDEGFPILYAVSERNRFQPVLSA